MMRRLFLAVVLSLVVIRPSFADSIGIYSPSSQPFEAFDWTPLDLAAFAAYGGDFANVRKPVEHIRFFETSFLPTEMRGPEDVQAALRFLPLGGAPPQFHFEELPVAGRGASYDELPVGKSAIPEPASAMLVGLGLLGVSSRMRRAARLRRRA